MVQRFRGFCFPLLCLYDNTQISVCQYLFCNFFKKILVCETRTIKQGLQVPINPVCLCRINNKIVYWKKLTGSKTGELLQKTGSNWKVNGNHGL